MRDDIYSKKNDGDPQSLLIDIDKEVLDTLGMIIGKPLRPFPYKIVYKVGLLQKSILDDVNKNFFKNRS